MSNVLERLRKKRAFPVMIDGQEFHVRTPTIGELRRLDAMTADNRTGFLVGCTLCSDASGVQEIPKQADEEDAKWAERVLDALADVPTETIRALSDGVAKISQTPTLEVVVKN